MVSKSLYTCHSERKKPSSNSSISSELPNPREEIEKNIQTPTTRVLKHSDNQPPESPEVQDLIHKLKGFSLSADEFEISEGSVTSKFVSSKPLTRLQSEILGIPPKEFPLPSRVKTKRNQSESESDISSSSHIQSPVSQTTTHQSVVVSTSSVSITSVQTPPVSTTPSMIVTIMAQRPWATPGAVNMAAPLHDLLDNPGKWLPKFSPDLNIQAEEHINNFMLAINLNGVVHEDVVVRLFHYTLQGVAGS